MKALTLTQPWATLGALGAKKLETRSWPTIYRGWIAIHAAKAFPAEAKAYCQERAFAQALVAGGYGEETPGILAPRYNVDVAALPLGAVVAVARIVDCKQICEEYAWGKVEGHLRRGEPVPQIFYRYSYEWTDEGGKAGKEEWYRLPPPEPELLFGNYAVGRWVWKWEDVHRLEEPIPVRGGRRLWNWDAPDSITGPNGLLKRLEEKQ